MERSAVTYSGRREDDRGLPHRRSFVFSGRPTLFVARGSGGKNEPAVQLGKINQAVNLAIRPASDWAQYGSADFWASPLQTLASGSGDCEDYAIVKYVVLRALGMAEADLRLIIVNDDKHKTEHAIVAVRDGQGWLILDNRTMFIVKAEDARYYNPLFVLEQNTSQTFAAASMNSITDR